jgi:hypothetical protein
MKLLSALQNWNFDSIHRIDYTPNHNISHLFTYTIYGICTQGLFLIRGTPRTVTMFNMAWQDYKTITQNIKHNPGKDQALILLLSLLLLLLLLGFGLIISFLRSCSSLSYIVKYLYYITDEF